MHLLASVRSVAVGTWWMNIFKRVGKPRAITIRYKDAAGRDGARYGNGSLKLCSLVMYRLWNRFCHWFWYLAIEFPTDVLFFIIWFQNKGESSRCLNAENLKSWRFFNWTLLQGTKFTYNLGLSKQVFVLEYYISKRISANLRAFFTPGNFGG